MAALCSLNRTASQLHATVSSRTVAAPRASSLVARAYKVQINQEGTVHTLEIPDGKTILEVALDKGLDLPHDCKLGVCMTCPAKLVRVKRVLHTSYSAPLDSSWKWAVAWEPAPGWLQLVGSLYRCSFKDGQIPRLDVCSTGANTVFCLVPAAYQACSINQIACPAMKVHTGMFPPPCLSCHHAVPAHSASLLTAARHRWTMSCSPPVECFPLSLDPVTSSSTDLWLCFWLQTKGVVDQSGSMLSDDVAEKGYVLMCMAMPQSDCEIVTVTEVSASRARDPGNKSCA